MKKFLYWLLSGLALIVINLAAAPIALFSLFGTVSGTSIFSVDYLIAFTIMFIPNIVTISLFVSAKKQHANAFFTGLGIAVLEAIALVTLVFNMELIIPCVVIVGLCAMGGLALILKLTYVSSTKLVN